VNFLEQIWMFNGGAEDGTIGWTIARILALMLPPVMVPSARLLIAGSSSFRVNNDGGFNQSVELIPESILYA